MAWFGASDSTLVNVASAPAKRAARSSTKKKAPRCASIAEQGGDFRFWHETVVHPATSNVRYRGMNKLAADIQSGGS